MAWASSASFFFLAAFAALWARVEELPRECQELQRKVQAAVGASQGHLEDHGGGKVGSSELARHEEALIASAQAALAAANELLALLRSDPSRAAATAVASGMLPPPMPPAAAVVERWPSAMAAC